MWPFLLAAGAAIALAACAVPRGRLTAPAFRAGLLALLAWGAFAALAPTLLGIDHRGLLSIVGAGDATALHKGFPSYPLRTHVPIAAGFGLLGLLAARTRRARPAPLASGG